jgi:hypothetical protein
VKAPLVAFALACAAAFGCSTTKPPPAGVSPGPDIPPLGAADAGTGAAKDGDPEISPKEQRLIARTLAKVAELRGIEPTRPVPGIKLDRAQLVARVKEKALREYPPDALRREGQLLQLMGFAPSSFDYLAEMLKLLDAQLEGFYEPKNGTMYLASDLRGTQAAATLAHELVHALQDQKWDLKARSNYRPGRGDETMALAALAEGDATSLMLDFVMADQQRTALDLPDELVRELMKSGVGMEGIESVPHILRTTLVSPYIEGMGFVNALRRKGGWALVDKAWDRPPATTEQILHVDKWETSEPALEVPAPTGQALGAAWKKDDEDTFGELAFALMFAEWVDPNAGRVAASGWGGDRSAVYTKGDEIAFAVHVRYDAARPEAAFAERAFTTLAAGWKATRGKPALADAATICFEQSELGPLLLARKGRDLTLIAGPAKTTGDVWASSGTCASAKTWATEILAQK